MLSKHPIFINAEMFKYRENTFDINQSWLKGVESKILFESLAAESRVFVVDFSRLFFYFLHKCKYRIIH